MGLVIALLIATTLSSCNKDGLSGTYVPAEANILAYDTIVFSGDKITLTQFTVPTEGTYKINGDNLIFSAMGVDLSLPYEKIGDNFKLNGIEYKKK
jgi:hypothetical protein